jgi:hypothetical protein
MMIDATTRYTLSEITAIQQKQCPGCAGCDWALATAVFFADLKCKSCELYINFIGSDEKGYKFDCFEIGGQEVYYAVKQYDTQCLVPASWFCTTSDDTAIKLPESSSTPDLTQLLKKVKQIMLIS